MIEFTYANADYFGLAQRELQLVALFEAGLLTRKGIANKMGIEESTVREYTNRLCEDYDCPPRELAEKIRERAAKENLARGR